MMDATAFQKMATEDVAALLRREGGKVAVFPINGTRRWFLLEHTPQGDDWLSEYSDIAAQRHIELYQMLFDHGLDTLLTPIFGPDLLERGGDYMAVFAEGLARIAEGEDFVDFYHSYGVRVHFYGDHRRFFAPTPYAYLSDLFDSATARTQTYDRHRLFVGVCAHDATETIAELSIRYHAEHGCVPSKRSLVELYYGEYVEPVDLFIGFDKFCVFDMPLLATGSEDLYFTVCPSPYLGEKQLREILYDHLYSRREGEPDYAIMEPEGWAYMKAFYEANQGKSMGVGMKRGPIWYPLPQVELPMAFQA
jgi:tuberculosinol/isotuberculosinol synthase